MPPILSPLFVSRSQVKGVGRWVIGRPHEPTSGMASAHFPQNSPDEIVGFCQSLCLSLLKGFASEHQTPVRSHVRGRICAHSSSTHQQVYPRPRKGLSKESFLANMHELGPVLGSSNALLPSIFRAALRPGFPSLDKGSLFRVSVNLGTVDFGLNHSLSCGLFCASWDI